MRHTLALRYRAATVRPDGPSRSSGGWREDHNCGKATIRLRPTDMVAVPDEELRALIRAALNP